MQEFYFDNSATTRPYPEVVEQISKVAGENYGNPSAMHEKGLEAEKIVKEARRRIAAFFRNREKEITFTSGGTEANNLAIKGAALRNRQRGNHLVTSEVEHPSVLNCFRYLEQIGFEVTYLPVNEKGLVNHDRLKDLISDKTILVSIMHVNNEIGTIQPLEKIGPLIKKKNPGALFHVDAVQSFTRLPMAINDWQVDLVSCSAHKIHGPRGAGCLWIREGTLLQPLLHGGGQENELRPGTENVPAIAGFGLAARLTGEKQRKKTSPQNSLKLAFYQKLQLCGVEVYVNGPLPEESAEHILSLSFPELPSEMLLHSLAARGIYVSAGSACHSRRPEPSHILQALKLSQDRLESALRFSFSCYNNEQEIEAAAQITAEITKELKSIINQ